MKAKKTNKNKQEKDAKSKEPELINFQRFINNKKVVISATSIEKADLLFNKLINLE